MNFQVIRGVQELSGDARDSVGFFTHRDGATSAWFASVEAAAAIKDVATLESLSLSYLTGATAIQRYNQLSTLLAAVTDYLRQRGSQASAAELMTRVTMTDLTGYFAGGTTLAADEKAAIEDTMLALAILSKLGHPENIDYQVALKARIVLGMMYASSGTLSQLDLNSLIASPIMLPAWKYNKCTKKYELTRPFPHLKLETSAGGAQQGKEGEPEVSRDCDCGCGETPCTDQNACCAPLFFYVADLMTLKEDLICYDYGQLAYIENIMAGETRERKHSLTESDETVTDVTVVNTRKDTRDLTISEKFSLKNALKETNKSENKFQVGVKTTFNKGSLLASQDGAKSSFVPSLTINANFDYTGTFNKEEVKDIARDYSREMTEKAVSVLEETITESFKRTRKIEISESNLRNFMNSSGVKHIIGQYFFVDMKSKAQVINHGRRLMFDFVLPEPMKLYREMMEKVVLPFGLTEPEKPTFLPQDISAEESTDALSYSSLIREWNLKGVTPLPDVDIYMPFAFGTTEKASDDNETLVHRFTVGTVPAGYNGRQVVFDLKAYDVVDDGPIVLRVELMVDGKHSPLGTQVETSPVAQRITWDVPDFDATQNSLVEAVVIAKSCVGVAGSGFMRCDMSDQAIQTWKLNVYEKVMEAYDAKLAEYKEAKEKFEKDRLEKLPFGRNPLQNRRIEFTEIKRLAISYISCQFYDRFTAMKHKAKPCGYPEMDLEQAYKDGLFIQFFEQVFDWELMGYIFYDYFWNGHKCEWPELMQIYNEDPELEYTLKAGAARVQVPVRLGSEWPALYWAAFGDVWMGTGQPPLPNSPYYVSVAQEIKEQKQCYYKDRPGTLAGTVGINTVTLTYGPNDTPEYPAMIAADIDREIIINCEIYRIVAINTGSNANEWEITLDRDYVGNGCCNCDTPANFTNLKYHTGGIFVGAPFEVKVPTNLVTLRNKVNSTGASVLEDCLPCYPIGKCE